MKFSVISNALFASVFFVFALFTAALAEDYTIPVVVDGKSYTLTVSVDGDEITGASSDSNKVKVGEPTKVMKIADASPQEGYDGSISYDDLFRHSEEYVGHNVEYYGSIQQVTQKDCADCKHPSYIMRVAVTKGDYAIWDETIWLEIESATRFREDDLVTFRGEYYGIYEYTSALNVPIEVPAVIGHEIQLGNHLGSGQAASSPVTSDPTANKSANLRSGPGTNYAVVGSVRAGQALKIVGKTQDGSWLKLEDGKWVATFLVNNVPTDLPVESPSVPESAPIVIASSTPTPQQPKQQTTSSTDWRSVGVQTCGDFEWKVVDVRNTKETWHYDEKTVARGQYLILYVEIKNVGPGTSDLESSSAPRLNGRGYDFDPSWDAAWMMTGGHNVTWNDYNPGEIITVVAGFDVQPGDGHVFGMVNCGQYVNIGVWDQIVKGVIRAS